MDTNKIAQWIKQNRTLAITLSFAIVVVTAVVVYGAFFSQPASQETPAVDSKQKPRQLTIESEPAGIGMTGRPHCDSASLQKSTPYTCDIKDNKYTTDVVAPVTITIDGKIYYFITWDGCSESNEDKTICAVELKQDKQAIKATYSLQPPAASEPTGEAKKETDTPKPPTSATSPKADQNDQCLKSMQRNVATNTATCQVTIAVSHTLALSGYGYLSGSQYHLGGSFNPPVTVHCGDKGCSASWFKGFACSGSYCQSQYGGLNIAANESKVIDSEAKLSGTIDLRPNGWPVTIKLSMPIEQTHNLEGDQRAVLSLQDIATHSEYAAAGYQTKVGYSQPRYYLSLRYNEKCRYSTPATSCQ